MKFTCILAPQVVRSCCLQLSSNNLTDLSAHPPGAFMSMSKSAWSHVLPSSRWKGFVWIAAAPVVSSHNETSDHFSVLVL